MLRCALSSSLTRTVSRFVDNRWAVCHGGSALTAPCVSAGPSITDPKMDMIVVSKETQAGGAMCNEIRAGKGWPAMAVETIDLVSEGGAVGEHVPVDQKMSSSGARAAAVGTLLDGDALFCRQSPSSRPCVSHLLQQRSIPFSPGLTRLGVAQVYNRTHRGDCEWQVVGVEVAGGGSPCRGGGD